MTRMQSGIWIASVALLAGSTSGWADEPVAAITRPNKDITLSFVRPGQISRILVKEGATVKVGQGLVQLDDAAEQAQLAQLIGTQASAFSRLEDADYDGHSLRMLRLIAAALGHRVEIKFVRQVQM